MVGCSHSVARDWVRGLAGRRVPPELPGGRRSRGQGLGWATERALLLLRSALDSSRGRLLLLLRRLRAQGAQLRARAPGPMNSRAGPAERPLPRRRVAIYAFQLDGTWRQN